jgi:hypothetical protein
MATYTELEQKLNRVRAEEARIQLAMIEKRRSEDLRIKILYGAAVIGISKNEDSVKNSVLQYLDEVTTKNTDRVLLGLVTLAVVS